MAYVGHKLSAWGLESDPMNVTAINRMETPTCKADLQRFLQKLSDMWAPLRSLLQDKAEWLWTETHNQVITLIKEAVTSTPVLQFFYAHGAVTVQCEAPAQELERR